MTDEPHMDETRPDQATPAAEPGTGADAKPEPWGFGDLPIQPTGSGVADQDVAYEQMVVDAGEGVDAPDEAVDPARPLR